MKKNPPVCPSCGTVFEAEAPVRGRRGRAAEKRPVVEAPAVVKEVEVPVAAGDDEAEEAVIEDAEELGEDAVEEVVAVEEEA
jgi:hypothetical protein